MKSREIRETFLSFWETIIAGPEAAVGAPLPMEAQLDYVAQTINAAATRVVSTLAGVPEQIRFEANQVANVTEDTVAAIRRNLPQGITDAFVPEEADTIQMWNNLPRFGRDVAMSEVEQARLMAPVNTVPRSYAENVERLMDTIDREFEAAQRESAAAWEQQWAGIKERSMMKVRLSDIRIENNRGGVAPDRPHRAGGLQDGGRDDDHGHDPRGLWRAGPAAPHAEGAR